MSMARRLGVVVAVVAACFAVYSRASAQCAYWPVGLIPPITGAFGIPSAATMWDPDGGGPLVPVLVVGNFYGVYTWDGVAWRRLGGSVPGLTIDRVQALTVHNGMLIAGGSFADANRRHVAWWTGNGWASLGTGVGNGSNDQYVAALTSFEGELIAVGSFNTIDGTPANNAARWDGATWHSMGSGVANYQNGIYGTSLAVHDPDGIGPAPAQLHAGETNAGFWTWNGNAWFLDNGPGNRVFSMAVHDNVLYAAGERVQPNPNQPPVEFSMEFYYRTPPSWSYYWGNSLSTPGPLLAPRVNAMTSWGGNLIIGGRFQTIGHPPSKGIVVNNVIRFANGGSLPMANGLGGTQAVHEVTGFAGSPGMLYAAGFFNLLGNGAPARGVAAWNGLEWSRVKSPTIVRAMTPFGTGFAIGGEFQADNGSSVDSEHLVDPAVNVAIWNGSEFTRLGEGTNGAVRALLPLTTSLTSRSLITAGDFTVAGGVAVNRVARWNQSDTNPLQTGWATMGSGFNQNVHTLAFGSQGVIVAGGAFTASGVTGLNRMARWSTSLNQWLPFATGGGTDMNGNVNALKSYSPNMLSTVLVAGGDFTLANNQACNRIAMWTEHTINGTTPWTPLGAGFNGSVHAIERHNGSIYAAGDFTASGATSLGRIARWAGASWVPVGVSTGFDGTVRALKSTGGYLYAVGDFTNVDGIPKARIARWNGSLWESVGNPISGAQHAIGTYLNEVLFGGASALLSYASWYYDTPAVSRYSETGLPVFLLQPVSQAIPCRTTASFSFGVPDGYSNGVIAGWGRNGVSVTGGPTGTGSEIEFGPTFIRIFNAGPADAGDYNYVIANGCGSVASAPATLSITTQCCPGDVAGVSHGVVDVADLLAVLSQWGQNGPPRPPADVAPFPNGDFTVNVSDLLAVLSGWGTCPP